MLQQIRRFLSQSPFQPFEIHCSNGEVLRVEHPENAAVVGHYVTMALPDGENAALVSALHIVSVLGNEQMAA